MRVLEVVKKEENENDVCMELTSQRAIQCTAGLPFFVSFGVARTIGHELGVTKASAEINGARENIFRWFETHDWTARGKGFFFSAATKLVGLWVKVNEAEQEQYARMICHNQD